MGNSMVAANVVMFFSYSVMASSFWCKKRKHILGLQVIACSLFTLQYLLLGDLTAVVLNCFSVLRAIIFAKKDEGKKGRINWSSNWVLYIFSAAYIISTIVTWKGAISIYSFMATIVYTIGMWADKPQLIRGSANIASVFWILLNFNLGGYVGCVAESILFISNAMAMIKHAKKKNINEEKNGNNVELKENIEK